MLLLHPGTQYAHRLACQLNRLELLDFFITGIAYSASNPVIKLLPNFIRHKISNRMLDCGIPGNKIKRIAFPEFFALYQLSRGKNPLQVMYLRNKRFQRAISTRRIDSADAVIGFDTSSWLLAQRVVDCGKPFLLDQSTIHAKEKIAVVDMLKNQFPEWFIELPDKSPHQMQIEEEEYQISNIIVVASTFTKNSLVKNGIAGGKIRINPYGVSESFFAKKTERKGRIRFLYLGLIGPAKGVPLLLQVWREFGFHLLADLWLAGPAPAFFKTMIAEMAAVAYMGKIPHSRLPEVLAECDVLVFPSFFDGFGQVILEAMAAGLPVITTEATAGPDIIEHEKDGFVITSGDRKELAESMRRFITDRALCSHMGGLAQQKARSFSWNAYGDRWKEILNSA